MEMNAADASANLGLRERQKELAKDTILSAAAEVVAEEGLQGFSMPDIARRASVSQRTVYNYFPNRSELIDALVPWIGQMITERGGRDTVDSLAEIPAAIRVNLRIFGELAGLTRAFARVESHSEAAIDRDRAQRSASFLDLAEAGLPDLEPSRARAIGAVLRVLASSRSWDTFTSDLGLSSDETVDVVAWAAESIIAAAHDSPSEREDE